VNECGELLFRNLRRLQIDVQSEQQHEYDSVDLVETAQRLLEHFEQHVLVDALHALQQNLRLLRPNHDNNAKLKRRNDVRRL